jgi:hypothetical protein
MGSMELGTKEWGVEAGEGDEVQKRSVGDGFPSFSDFRAIVGGVDADALPPPCFIR